MVSTLRVACLLLHLGLRMQPLQSSRVGERDNGVDGNSPHEGETRLKMEELIQKANASASALLHFMATQHARRGTSAPAAEAATTDGTDASFTEIGNGYCRDYLYPSTGKRNGEYDDLSPTAQECMSRCVEILPHTTSFYLYGSKCGCSATIAGPCNVVSSANYTTYRIILTAGGSATRTGGVTTSCRDDYHSHKQCKTCINHAHQSGDMYRRNVICTSCHSKQYLKQFYETEDGDRVGPCLYQPSGLELPSAGLPPGNLTNNLAAAVLRAWNAPAVSNTWVPPAPVDAYVTKYVLTKYGIASAGAYRDNRHSNSAGDCKLRHTHSTGVLGWSKSTLLSKDADDTGMRHGSTRKSFQLLGMYAGYFTDKHDAWPPLDYKEGKSFQDGSSVKACCATFGGIMKAYPAWTSQLGKNNCFISTDTLEDRFPDMLKEILEQLPLTAIPL